MGQWDKNLLSGSFWPETTLTYASVHTLHALWPPNSLSVQCALQNTHDSFITPPETQKTTNTQVVKQFLGFLHVSWICGQQVYFPVNVILLPDKNLSNVDSKN